MFRGSLQVNSEKGRCARLSFPPRGVTVPPERLPFSFYSIYYWSYSSYYIYFFFLTQNIPKISFYMHALLEKASASAKPSKPAKKKSGKDGQSLDDKFFALHERMIRVEEELSHQREMLLLIQQNSDKRFEEMHRSMDKRFSDMQSDMDKRFSDMQGYMDKRFSMLQWLIGLGISLLAILIGFMRVFN